MDIEVWVRKDQSIKQYRPEIRPVAEVVRITTERNQSVDLQSLSWDQLASAVGRCTRCELHANRKQTVFGVGHLRADWMIIGEAPGADEDLQGEPFVGRAGQLLNSMLQAIGFPREQVYIANVLKCRPPANRDPKQEEVAACSGYLSRQIDMVNPRIILCVGRIAAQTLLGTETSLKDMRGRIHTLGEKKRPVVVTYHPAYLLRSPIEKRNAWQDLKFALQVYTQTPLRSV
jgi:DNA polymerase